MSLKQDVQSTYIAQRVHGFGESVIREMTRHAMQHNAINLAQGMPDFPTPEGLKELAIKAISDDHNQYPYTWGINELREAIALKHQHFYGQQFDPETDIVVCCGTSEAMLSTFLGLVNPGDEIIIFEPIYENYLPDTYLSQAKPVVVPLKGPDWQLDEEALRQAFSTNTKAIIINTPNNPTGKVFSKQELQIIADLCQQYDVLAFTDEIYEHIIYDNHQHIPIATLPGMHDRTVTITGFSKTFAITGWRVGYAAGPAHLIDPIRKVHDYATIGAPKPFQLALAQFLTQSLSTDYYTEMANKYQQRRDITMQILRDAGFRVHPPEGSYYVLADYTNLSNESSLSFSKRLIEEAGVSTVPGFSFYRSSSDADRYVRFCFPKQEATLLKAGEQLQVWTQTL